MTLQALLLDFGGTLAAESPSRGAIYAAAAAARGVELGAQEMGARMRRAHRELPREIGGGFRYSDPWFRAFLHHVFHDQLGLERALLPGLEEELFARFSDAATFRLFPGARELLSRARSAGLRVAVVSNWSERLALLLDRLGLAGQLDAIVSSAEERVEKPDAAIFQRALGRLDVPAAAALHAGDRLDTDVAGALAAGLRAVLVDRSGTIRTADAESVPSLGALAAHVEQLLS